MKQKKLSKVKILVHIAHILTFKMSMIKNDISISILFLFIILIHLVSETKTKTQIIQFFTFKFSFCQAHF